MVTKALSADARHDAKEFFEWMYSNDGWNALDSMLFSEVKAGKRELDDEVATLRLTVSSSGIRDRYKRYMNAKLSNNAKEEKAVFKSIEKDAEAVTKAIGRIRTFIDSNGNGSLLRK